MSAVPHQASCVAVDGRGILIEGPPGTGKSSLALALIDRGAVLVGDDGVLLDQRDGRLWALPPPNITGLLEVRNVGLLRLPATETAVALVIRLNAAAPRHIDQPAEADIAGVRVPLVTLWPDSPVLALRAECALTLYGIA